MQAPRGKHEISYTELRTGDIPGYVLDTGKVIVNSDIKKAVKITNENMLGHIKDIESSDGSGRKVKKFYIGKTHICESSRVDFDPCNSSTWALEGGINRRYLDHFNAGYGETGLLVLAVVTKESIPKKDAIDHQYIINQEEYAVILEKRLIQMYSFPEDDRDPRIANPSADAGHLDEKLSPGYVVYMAFKLRKCNLPH